MQLGATYKVGKAATGVYNAGITAAAKYINASPDEVVIGPSTTQLFRNLSSALRPHFPPDSEIICSTLDHEANIASWLTLASDLNLTVKWWTPRTPSSSNPQLTPDSLAPLLNKNTRLVTATHSSNILGSVTPVRALADLLHAQCPGALLCVDGVAYAPHRPIDVRALGADIYAFSWYKCFGPHVAQLYVAKEVQERSMRSLGHFFKEANSLEERLGLAGASYELVQSVPRVTAYLAEVGWDGVRIHERRLQEVLLSYLRVKREVYRICGVVEGETDDRLPVISFVVKGRNSREVVEKVEAENGFGFRWGHFYSKRLVNDVLELDDDGVIRVSMVHYNTVEEIEAFVKALDKEVCG